VPDASERRATGVEACLGPWTGEVDGKDPPTPPGFTSGMHRGHLLARRLGGHSILENIVPLYRLANTSGMSTVEIRLQGMAKTQPVYFFTRPTYVTKANQMAYAQYKDYIPISVLMQYATKGGPVMSVPINNNR
jgi:hypothetical protein